MMNPWQASGRISVALAFAAAAMLLVSACSITGGPRQYRLLSPEIEMPPLPAGQVYAPVLALTRPEADRARDSSRILVRHGRALKPWSGAVWADGIPDLLQTLAVEYLDQRVAVAGRYGSLPADYRLDLEVRRFELVDNNGRLGADIRLVARLLDAGGQLVDTARLASAAPAGEKSLDAGIGAMETALEEVFEELADWLATQLTVAAESD